MAKSFCNSKELFKKASTLIPGGVNSPVRAFKSVGGSPIYFEKAAGCKFTDADNNVFLDFCLSWGPLILGHAHPVVTESVIRACQDGLTYGACHRKEIEIAELLLEGCPGFQCVRLVNSGTEAVMTALRLARGSTERDLVVKFEGGYHGHVDTMLVKAGSGLVTNGVASSKGVPSRTAESTLVAQLDNIESVENIFSQYGKSIAAIIIEPVPANNGLLLQRKEFLQALRDITHKYGSLLIFDEVISGFRFCYGGVYQELGIIPDIVTMGKIIGGGMPVGAIIGSEKIMNLLSPNGEVYQAGTLSGNPVALAAGIATLKELKKTDPYPVLDNLGHKLASTIQDFGHPFIKAIQKGSIVWLYLDEGNVPRAPHEIHSNAVARYNQLYWKIIDKGYYLPPSAYEVLFLCTSHTLDDVQALGKQIVNTLLLTN